MFKFELDNSMTWPCLFFLFEALGQSDKNGSMIASNWVKED